jgi:hypothetical protein
MTKLDTDGPQPRAATSKASTERLTARDFPPEVLQLFDGYVHGLLDRRGFLEQAAKYVLAGSSAIALLDALSPRFAAAQQVPTDDARLHTEYVEIASPAAYGKLRAYSARPRKAAGKLPSVLVVHENRGLNPHIEDAWSPSQRHPARDPRVFSQAGPIASNFGRSSASSHQGARDAT